MPDLFINPHARKILAIASPSQDPVRFHQKLPDYSPTPLLNPGELKNKLKVGTILVKHENDRFGLPAFKVLGASWAVYQLLKARYGIWDEHWKTVEDLKERLNIMNFLSLLTATDGNHGRGVARVAKWFGFTSRVFMPKGTTQMRIDDIRSEGATVEVVEGNYDKAVETAGEHDGPVDWLIQDTGWDGYERIPKWIVEGYSTIFQEIEGQLPNASPDIVFVPIGVGSLAEAVVRHFKHGGQDGEGTPAIIGVEPVGVACGFESVQAERPVTIWEPGETIMSGLNCGTLSTTAWPLVRDGIDVFVTVGDDRAREAIRLLHDSGIESGPSGASGLAGLLEVRHHPQVRELLASRGVEWEDATVLLIATEGVTDPESHQKIINHQ